MEVKNVFLETGVEVATELKIFILYSRVGQLQPTGRPNSF
jgi:hypothetical protein